MQIYSFKALNLKDKINAVKSLLNRPIRVCGKKMKGTWRRSLLVTTQNNVVTLQIVESCRLERQPSKTNGERHSF
jgi:hypothetical protein